MRETDVLLAGCGYASTISPGCGQADIDAILEFSRTANELRQIGGVLSFDGRNIAQILEGEAEVIDRLFDRIRIDPRHQGVVEFSRVLVDLRRFPGWRLIRQKPFEVALMSEVI